MGTLVGTPVAAYEASAADANIAVTYGTAVASGDVAVVFLGGYHATATVSSITSSVSTSISQTVGTLLRDGGSPNSFLAAHVFVFSAAGTPTFTGTMSAAHGDKKIAAIVWSGIDNTTPVEGTNGGTGADESAETGDVTTTNPGPAVASLQEFNWATAHNHNIGTPNTGWTEWGDTATGSDNKYQNFTDTGTRNGNFTWTTGAGGDTWCARVVFLRDAAAGGAALSIASIVQNYRNMRVM